jgi:ADP-ribose pyrophosphatase YjhB (NUDIX family)
MERDKRVYAALVAAGLIIDLDSRILLVAKRGKLTLPTGHMDLEKDENLEEALVREMKEEMKDENGQGINIRVLGSLGTVVRNKDTDKSKLIEIFRCVTDSRQIFFEEKGETELVRVKIDEALGIKNLDDLAREAITRLISYLEGHIAFRRRNGGNHEEGTDFSDEQEANNY